jgi:hypothetical protein
MCLESPKKFLLNGEDRRRCTSWRACGYHTGQKPSFLPRGIWDPRSRPDAPILEHTSCMREFGTCIGPRSGKIGSQGWNALLTWQSDDNWTINRLFWLTLSFHEFLANSRPENHSEALWLTTTEYVRCMLYNRVDKSLQSSTGCYKFWQLLKWPGPQTGPLSFRWVS